MIRDLFSMDFLLLAIAGFLLTTIGVALFRGYAASAGILDHPNERSSHTIPVPRGGGIVIVLVCIGLYLIFSYVIGYPVSWWYIGGGSVIAGVSWLDDRRNLPPIVRLATQAGAALASIYGHGYFSDLAIPIAGTSLPFGPLGAPLTFLWLVWMTNAYNFMDGIDGIAGLQGVVAGLAWALLGTMTANPAVCALGLIVCFSCLGFLVHNWSPARIFMGDVGSAFLGFTFALLPLMTLEAAGKSSGWLLAAGISFVWLFFFDTVSTLISRLIKGEKIWHAHRQHLYQRMVILGTGHASVSALYAALACTVSAASLYVLKNGAIAEIVFVLSLLFSAAAILFLGFRDMR